MSKAITDQGYSAPNITDDNPEKEVAAGYIPDGYESQAEFLKYARDLYSDDIDYDKENRDMALDDLKFIAGEQWDPDVKAAREGRPIITINTLPQYVGQVIGDRRMNKTTIKVRATKDASAKMANSRAGIIKSIEQFSRAERAYDMGLEDQVSCGIGNCASTWIMLTTTHLSRTFSSTMCRTRWPWSGIACQLIQPGATPVTVSCRIIFRRSSTTRTGPTSSPTTL
jgi:hypothetical protein